MAAWRMAGLTMLRLLRPLRATFHVASEPTSRATASRDRAGPPERVRTSFTSAAAAN